MGIERDVLQNLIKRPCIYDELKRIFPHADVAQLLIDMEEQHLAEGKNGIWSITEGGRKEIKKKRQLIYSLLIYSLLIAPVLIFSWQYSTFYADYADAQRCNEQLLQEKTEVEVQLSNVIKQKEGIEAKFDEITDKLVGEKNNTAQLNASYEEIKSAVDSLQGKITRFQCLEECTPDKFVTVDNAYVKAKVDEITAGLTTLREKQEALYNFVRDKIEYDESIYHFGRLDMWEYPEDILRRGKGGFEDKYLLLLTMLRIAGTPPDDVRFVAAEVDGNDSWAWVEAYDGTSWWILDPFEEYEFTSTPLDKFYDDHKVVILWWFNDTEFAIG